MCPVTPLPQWVCISVTTCLHLCPFEARVSLEGACCLTALSSPVSGAELESRCADPTHTQPEPVSPGSSFPQACVSFSRSPTLLLYGLGKGQREMDFTTHSEPEQPSCCSCSARKDRVRTLILKPTGSGKVCKPRPLPRIQGSRAEQRFFGHVPQRAR